MPPVGFEPTISSGERPQTYVLDRAATGTGQDSLTCFYYSGVGSFTLPRVAQRSQLIDIQGLAIHVPKYTTKNTACNDTYLILISRWRLTTENETMLARKYQQINCNTCYTLQEVDRMASS